MTRDTWRIIAAAAIAGFLGAGLEHMVTSRSVHAQELIQPKTLTAENLVLVDSEGARRVVLSGSPSGGTIVLMDSKGRKRLEMEGSGRIRVFNQQQQQIWAAPESTRMFPLSE